MQPFLFCSWACFQAVQDAAESIAFSGFYFNIVFKILLCHDFTSHLGFVNLVSLLIKYYALLRFERGSEASDR